MNHRRGADVSKHAGPKSRTIEIHNSEIRESIEKKTKRSQKPFDSTTEDVIDTLQIIHQLSIKRLFEHVEIRHLPATASHDQKFVNASLGHVFLQTDVHEIHLSKTHKGQEHEKFLENGCFRVRKLCRQTF